MSDQRFEAAKAALQGMRSNPEYAENSSEEIAMFAQVDADSLLARLKETEPVCRDMKCGGEAGYAARSKP